MKTLKSAVVLLFSGIVILSLQAFTIGKLLIPKAADPATVSGTYNLILYGCRYPQDLENMAILVNTNSQYPLEVYAGDGMYKIKSGLSASQALSEANKFLTCSMHTLWQTALRAIPDGSGKAVGYELKPLYRNFAPGEPLLSSYSLKDGKVTAYIRLDPAVEHWDSGSGRRDSSGGS